MEMNKSEMVRKAEIILDSTNGLSAVRFKYDYKRSRFVATFSTKFKEGKDTYNAWSRKDLKFAKKIVKIMEELGLDYINANWNWSKFYEMQKVKLYFNPKKD